MPIVAIILGAVLVVIALRGTEYEFGDQLESDFGQTAFWSWAAAILFLGALGYVPALRRVSQYSVGLVVLVMVLRNGGLFTQLARFVDSPPSPAPVIPLPSGSSGGSGIASALGDVASFASTFA